VKNLINIAMVVAGSFLGLSSIGISGINDGTLPLMLMGNAIDLNNQGMPGLATTLQFRDVSTNDIGNRATFKCVSINPNQTRHKATGLIRVGREKFAIKGVCIIEENGRQKIEVISANSGKKAVLSGFFSERAGRRVVTGRLQVIQGQQSSGRFEINVRSNRVDLTN